MERKVTLLDLSVWAQTFAALVGAGISLMRSLQCLSAQSGGCMEEVTQYLGNRLAEGATLSEGMSELPEVFCPLDVTICRAGEIGGVLDESLAVWAKWLEREWDFRVRRDQCLLLAKVAGLGETSQEIEGVLKAALPDEREAGKEIAFCRILGMCLGDVRPAPFGMVLEVGAEVYGDEQDRAVALRKAGSEAAAESGEPFSELLERLGFSPVVCELARIGELTSDLGRMMNKAADVLEHEWQARMTAALSKLIEHFRL